MRDPMTSLAERLDNALKDIAFTGKYPNEQSTGALLAAEALAHVREVLTREKIIQELIKQFGLDCKVCDPKWYAPMADAILRLLDGEATDGS